MRTVLIVEDELLEQEFLKKAVARELTPTESRVLTCGCGTEAVTLAKQYIPDVIILDLLLPELDGLSAMKEIRKFAPDTCVIILTASAEFSNAQTAISLGVYEYLLKPVRPSVFSQVFQKAVQSRPDITAGAPDPEPCETKAGRQEFIEKSVGYIHENYKGKLTLKMVASYVFMNPQYFSRVFKKELGVTYTDYVNDLRVKHACRLLETTDYPAYRISGECGFTDPSYFNRVFYQHIKMTPKKYKQRKGSAPAP